ncbi:MAG: branched-chain-amino-acid transaminase [Desulfobacteraceae bacterium]|nr:MAG: branched-chain-amino-acid transaminase [Desulfobacteraceae bacterium]
MLKDRVVYMNGEFVAWDKANIHMMSHSFSRGSAIFEVISVHPTDKGPVIFRLDEHAERLATSAKLLEMDLPLSREELIKATIAAVKRNGISQGFIKIMGFYPQVAFDILPPQPRLNLAIFVMDPAQDMGAPGFVFEKGTTLGISKWRKLDPQTIPIEAKVAANYMNGMMARQEARKRGFEHAIMLDTQGFIAEGGTESMFLVKEGRLFTPAAGTVLKSITRKSILEIAPALGIETFEKRLSPQLCWEAEEIFLSSTPFKVTAVRKMEERELKEVPGPISRKVWTALQQIEAGKDERFRQWLFPVK